MSLNVTEIGAEVQGILEAAQNLQSLAIQRLGTYQSSVESLQAELSDANARLQAAADVPAETADAIASIKDTLAKLTAAFQL